MIRRTLQRVVLAALVMASLSHAARAQPEIPDPDHPGYRYQALALEAMEAADYARAEALFRRQLEGQARNFVPWYNLACALAMQGRADEAQDALERSIELGFANLSHMLGDRHLAALRQTERFRALVQRWDEILDAQAEASFARLRAQYGPRYHYSTDPDLRVRFISEHDDEMFDLIREEVRTLTRWGIEHVFFNLREPGEPADHPDPWVTVIIPNERDFRRWAVQTFGPAALGTFSRIGGSYSHDRKQLVSMDLGGTLRHEYFHALHWRSNDRLGQVHAVWVQEGLCALVEDYDRTPDGGIRITRSWRTNVAHRMARAGTLMDLQRLASLSAGDFTGDNPLANYAQARAVFLFLYESDALGRWYRTYCETFDEDPTGIRAFEVVFGRSIDEVNAAYRAWAVALEEVPDTLRRPRARLGIETDAGRGAGLTVLQSGPDARPLRRGDIVIAIDGRPVRELNELLRVLGDYEPGQEVTLRYRRRDTYADCTIRLR